MSWSHSHLLLRRTSERGQGLVEYALILALVAVAAVVVLALAGPAVGNVFSNVVYQLNPAPSFADLNAAVQGCVTHTGAQSALLNAVSAEDLNQFTHLLSVHQAQLSPACYNSLSSLAGRMT